MYPMKTKKKNQKSSAAVTGSDVKSLIRDGSLFFDKLVELIPARFYLPASDDKEKVYFQGLTTAEKTEAKQKSIENIKKARRNRLDPSTSAKSTLDLLKESLLEGQKSEAEIDAEELDVNESKSSGPDGGGGGESSVTYEELQLRLRRKLEALKAGRGGGSGFGDDERRAERHEKKRKRDFERNDDGRNKGKKRDGEDDDDDFSSRKIEEEAAVAAEEIQFGKVTLDNDDRKNKQKKKKKKITKEMELEMARNLQEEAKKDPEKAQKHSWKAAANRAMGFKVHDNPKLLKESIQREKRKHKKSLDKWKDRVSKTESMKQERQDKRKGNIQAKIQNKKMKKIEKREKKLMNRPGFEGRKDGFINTN